MGAKHPIDLEMRWNFSDSHSTSLSLDEFLAQKETDGVEFFAGKEPWLVGLRKLSWQTFFRVCTEEMDDLSQRAVKLVIEYCLEVLEEVEGAIRGKASLARLEAALNVQYAEQYENKVFQYRWALRFVVETFFPELVPVAEFYGNLSKEAQRVLAGSRMIFVDDIDESDLPQFKINTVQVPNDLFQELGISVKGTAFA
jgi:hypothetical protein